MRADTSSPDAVKSRSSISAISSELDVLAPFKTHSKGVRIDITSSHTSEIHVPTPGKKITRVQLQNIHQYRGSGREEGVRSISIISLPPTSVIWQLHICKRSKFLWSLMPCSSTETPLSPTSCARGFSCLHTLAMYRLQCRRRTRAHCDSLV
jgi:hypothetical protein